MVLTKSLPGTAKAIVPPARRGGFLSPSRAPRGALRCFNRAWIARLGPVLGPAALRERAVLWVESDREFSNQRDFDSTCWLGGGQQEMAKRYSQDLRDRVIDAVKRGEMKPSRSSASVRDQRIWWLSNGLSELNGMARESPSRHGGHRASKLMPHRDFLEAARAEKSDVTLQALCAIAFRPSEGQSRHLDDGAASFAGSASRSKKTLVAREQDRPDMGSPPQTMANSSGARHRPQAAGLHR